MTDDIEAEELQSELKYGDWDNYEVEGRDD